jgi:hypothetical protein
MTLRRAGRMHHLGIGKAHARNTSSRSPTTPRSPSPTLTTGEVLSTHLIDPNRSYWRNQNKEADRWPSTPN